MWGTANLTHALDTRESVAHRPSPIGRYVRDYSEIIDACRGQATKLEVSRLETDRLAGLPDGHAGHILAKSFSKLIGPAYLLPLLEHLGLRLLLIEDPELIARTIARRTPRQRTGKTAHEPRLLVAPARDTDANDGTHLRRKVG